jgi:hypothetical protein
MGEIYWYIVLVVNFLIYGICCFMILKRKQFTIISVRSPTLFLITILANFFMSLVLILSKIIGLNFFSSFYFLFRMVMIVSMLLRYERIIICCGIYKNDAVDLQLFYTKRYMYLEKFYIRILVFIFAIFLLITIINIIIGTGFCEAFLTTDNNEIKISKLYIWVIWSFLEQMVIATYLFRTYDIISPKQFVKFELYSFLIIWFVYNNFVLMFTFIRNEVDDIALIIISLGVLYISLILSGYLPVIMSYTSNTLVTYHFTFKLMNNLYLFLTNETCYKSFNNYLISKKDNGSYLLKLYTHIMKYKLDFVLNVSDEQHYSSAVVLNNTFFEKDNNIIDLVVFNKVKNECKILNNNRFDKNQFDVALQYCFDELNKRFNEFKKSREYSELFAKITLTSYIRCKMCNVGLINKF